MISDLNRLPTSFNFCLSPTMPSECILFKGNSREEVIDWWHKVRYTEPFNKFVADRTDDPCVGQLRLRLEFVNKQENIADIVRTAGIIFQPVKKVSQDILSFICENPNYVYSSEEGNRFNILKSINDRGFFGWIFLAQNCDTKQVVVIKILKVAEDKEHLVMKKIQQNGSHPNIVQYLGSGTTMGKHWIAMEYLEGEPQVLYKQKHEWTKELMEQYQSGLAFLGKCGVTTQRENESENVMICQSVEGSPIVKLIDFGTLASP